MQWAAKGRPQRWTHSWRNPIFASEISIILMCTQCMNDREIWLSNKSGHWASLTTLPACFIDIKPNTAVRLVPMRQQCPHKSSSEKPGAFLGCLWWYCHPLLGNTVIDSLRVCYSAPLLRSGSVVHVSLSSDIQSNAKSLDNANCQRRWCYSYYTGWGPLQLATAD